METAPGSPPITVADYERLAAGVIEPGALGYFAGGAGDELTMRDNVAAWGRLALCPRMLVGVGERDPGIKLLGRPRPHPLIIAPIALQVLAHPDGERATAAAAAATGTIVCIPTLASLGPSALAEAVPSASRWFQLYVFRDRAVSHELVARAVDGGYEALVVTVDLPVFGLRERDRRTGVATNVELIDTAAAAGASGTMSPAEFAALIDPDLSWRDIERFVSECPLPVVVKGVLRPEDARLAADHGASAVVVSNHGGRQLDTVLSGADALAPIVDAVGDRLEVLVDGGVRRGIDVLKAIALGARAVMVGRPVLWGLAAGGADGVRHVLEILHAEFDNALALAGARTPAELDRSFTVQAPWVADRR